MKMVFIGRLKGFTVVELLVTVSIAVILSATLGMFFVSLLTIQEQDREEAYFRERLADICSSVADYLSVASSFSTRDLYDPTTGLTNQVMTVSYRQEAGGVSFETNVVSHVARVYSSLNTSNKTVDVNIDWIALGGGTQQISRVARGDAALLPLAGDIVSCRLTPSAAWETGEDLASSLGNLQIVALYQVKRRKFLSAAVSTETKTAVVERIVRLWNRQ